MSYKGAVSSHILGFGLRYRRQPSVMKWFFEILLDRPPDVFHKLKSSDTLNGRDPPSNPTLHDRVASSDRRNTCSGDLELLVAGQSGLLFPTKYAGVGSPGHPPGARLVGILYASRAPR